MATVYLGLGSNIGPQKKNLLKAINKLARLDIKIKKISGMYESTFEGYSKIFGISIPAPWPPVLNCALQADTDYSPFEVLQRILQIEKSLGRFRVCGMSNLPRIIDIDILFYNDMIITHRMLTVPHARLHIRPFVLVPLAEIAPNFRHPVFNKSVMELLGELQKKGVKNWPKLV
ncbi:MAG: 2-amino-4-hydroxy-6-hydroxymethyldihydropteridine diphosphokinase [candidate division WOR-3 bacterium]